MTDASTLPAADASRPPTVLQIVPLLAGGGIARAGDALLRPLQKYLDVMEWRPGGHRAQLIPAQLGEFAGAFGAARNAVDCALWELEARQKETTVMALAGIADPRPLVTVCTVGADTPEAMAQQALAYGGVPALKLKLTEDPSNADRVRAVRAAGVCALPR